MAAEPDDALVVFRQQSVRRQTVSVSGLLAKRLATRSERTREAYGRDLRAFADHVGCPLDEALTKLINTPTTIAQDVVLGYQAALAEAGLANATINRRISALRSVLKLARAAGLTTLRLEAVETLDVEVGSRDVRGPGIAVIKKILEVCDADQTPRGVRDGRILRWFVGTGLRRSELRQLTLADLRQTSDGWVVWVRAKGVKGRDKKRPVTIESWLVDDLQAWLAVRGDKAGAIFTSLHRAHTGAMLNAAGLNQILRRRAKEAGFSMSRFAGESRNVTPHALRHTAITEVIRADGLAAAQAFARHKSPATTQRYNDDKDALARAGQRTLRGKLGAS